VHFFRQVLGIRAITKEALAKRTHEYRQWVEAYARNHKIPYSGLKGRSQGRLRAPLPEKMEKQTALASTSFSKAWTRNDVPFDAPKYPTDDPDYRILATQRSRFMHYYFYIRDEMLGRSSSVATFLPFQHLVTNVE